MPQKFLRKYGALATIDFTLFETDGVDLKTDASFVSTDCKIMKDEGAEANTTNTPTDEGQGYSLALTATEMQAARIVVYVVDAATKAWLDDTIVIETYGNASAQHAFDLDNAINAASGIVESNMKQIDDDSVTGNAATLTLKQLDIQNSAGAALVAKSTGGNGHGMDVAGNGTGEGIKSVGGATGDGMYLEAGATSGSGLYVKSPTAGWGIRAEGNDIYSGIYATSLGSGHAMELTGGASGGSGIKAKGGSTSGSAVIFEAPTSGIGFSIIGKNSAGMQIASDVTYAINCNGTGGDIDAVELETIDTNVDAILVDTGTTLPGTLSTIEGKVDTIDTVVDAILVDTTAGGAGPWTTGSGGDATEAKQDEILANLSTVDTNVDAVLVDTGTTLPAQISGLNNFDPANDTVDVGKISGDSTAADNLEAILDGTGAALTLKSSTQSPLHIEATGGNFSALKALGDGTGNGGEFQSGTGADADGIYTMSNASSDGNGIRSEGADSGHGYKGTGGATGHGFFGLGGVTSGNGMKAQAQGGNSSGLKVEGVGIRPGLQALSVGTGNGADFEKGSGGKDINAEEIDNILTNLATVDTNVDAILVDTTAGGAGPWTTGAGGDATEAKQDEILANLSTVDTVVDGVKVVTDNLPNSGALTDISNQLTTIDTNVDNLLATMDDMTEDDGGVTRYTANALEEAPTGGGDATEAKQDEILANLSTVDTNVDTALVNLTTIDTNVDAILVDTTAGGAGPWTTGAGGDATEAKQDEILANLSTVDTNVDTALVNLTTIDTVVDAIKVVTDNLPNSGALTDISNQLTTIDTVVDAIKVKTDTRPDGVKKNTSLSNFEFFMVDTADHISGKTGLTVTGTVSLDGAAFTALTNSVSEVGSGIYKIDLAAADMNADFLTLRFTGAGADDRLITIKTDE